MVDAPKPTPPKPTPPPMRTVRQGSIPKVERPAAGSFLTPEIVSRTFRDIDSWGMKRWPVQWIRVRRVGLGWKTICGAALFYAPDIMEYADRFAPSVVSAMGMEDAKAVLVTKWIGMALFGIGVLDKYLKFNRPLERRARARSVTSNSGLEYILAPVSSAPVAPLPVVAKMTPVEQVIFDSVFETEVKRGATLEVARDAAIGAVWTVRNPPSSTPPGTPHP